MNGKRRKPKNKAEAGLCSHIGCRVPRHLTGDSIFCTYHRDEFFYLDMAHEVNVTGIHLPISGLLKKVKKDQKVVLDRYFADKVEKKMKSLSLSGPYEEKCAQSNIIGKYCCEAKVKHDSYLCPRHLRLKLLRQCKWDYERSKEEDFDPKGPIEQMIALPEEVQEELDKIGSVLNSDIVKEFRCRYRSDKGMPCTHTVEDFMHLGYCKYHIHNSQSILCIMRRHKVLHCQKMLSNLLEIVCSYI